MDFEPVPEHDAARKAAETLCSEVLATLPRTPDDFFREAYRALGDRGAFADDSIATAACTAMTLGAASGSLALTFAACYGFAWASRRFAANGASSIVQAPADSTLGVLAFGSVAAATAASTSKAPLTGSASMVVGGPVATHVVVVSGTRASGVAALVDLARGVAREPPRGALGFDSVPRCTLHFDGAPFESLAHEAHEALRSVERVLGAAIAVGIGRHALRLAVEHLRTLEHPPSQSTEFSLSDVATDLEAAELSVLRAAWTVDSRDRHALESASAKLLATRAATRSAHAALALTSDGGYTDDLRQCYLDAGALDGTGALQEETIASEMLEES